MGLERIAFMRVESGVATFEREDGTTFDYSVGPEMDGYKEGDVIKAFICEQVPQTKIHFICRDDEEMKRRKEQAAELKAKLTSRIRRNT